jgi:hypothetical protein
MNVEELELLPDDALRHNTSEVLNHELHTAVLRERESVEINTLLPINGRLYGSRP